MCVHKKFFLFCELLCVLVLIVPEEGDRSPGARVTSMDAESQRRRGSLCKFHEKKEKKRRYIWGWECLQSFGHGTCRSWTILACCSPCSRKSLGYKAVIVFKDGISLCSCPRTLYVDCAGLKLTEICPPLPLYHYVPGILKPHLPEVATWSLVL